MKEEEKEQPLSTSDLARRERKHYESIVARGKSSAPIRRRLEECIRELRRPRLPAQTASS